MPRRNNRVQRRQPAADHGTSSPTTERGQYEVMALSLVRRGLASTNILDRPDRTFTQEVIR